MIGPVLMWKHYRITDELGLEVDFVGNNENSASEE